MRYLRFQNAGDCYSARSNYISQYPDYSQFIGEVIYTPDSYVVLSIADNNVANYPQGLLDLFTEPPVVDEIETIFSGTLAEAKQERSNQVMGHAFQLIDQLTAYKYSAIELQSWPIYESEIAAYQQSQDANDAPRLAEMASLAEVSLTNLVDFIDNKIASFKAAVQVLEALKIKCEMEIAQQTTVKAAIEYDYVSVFEQGMAIGGS